MTNVYEDYTDKARRDYRSERDADVCGTEWVRVNEQGDRKPTGIKCDRRTWHGGDHSARVDSDPKHADVRWPK